MFDITGQDVSLLSDEDLRALIGRLCEAEVRRDGLSPLCVTWGGNQNAVDGGVDVRVSAGTAMLTNGVFARPNVGFQSKAEDMPRGKILTEMRPNDSVRVSIREIAKLRGSYIIVSSKGSVSDSALRERKRAMRDAVADIPDANNLELDFYDRDRLATWVRDHPGLVTWVRQKVGRPISGWHPYDDWAASREGINGTYLVDDSLRIQGPSSKGEGQSAAQGMERLRIILATERGVVRLVGLSGMGKTRLVQALFDDRVGQFALAPDLAIYTNISDDPSPQPIAVGTELVAQKRRQILIVDNCPPELHRRLSEICIMPESRISLLTVEYDVREDQPEGTDVFELQPSSDDLIEKLLLRRVSALSQVNASSIAKFASGNARVALALAHTIDSDESVASLKDSELFERLFRQRHESSNSLLVSAQACSLAYSFQGEDTSNRDDAEMSKLAAIVGKDVRSLYADVAELKRRNLIQQRGVWRALLPHAIANRLAAMALESIPSQDLDELFANASARLLRSISRRLGYLHTSQVTRNIVKGWLKEGGLLGRVEDLNDTGRAMLANVAPVAPVETIDAIERAILRRGEIGEHLVCEEFRTLLLSLAFERDLFDRCCALILDLIEFEEPGLYANRVRNSFPSLFHLYLSGTHATVEQRCKVVDGLLRSNSETRRELGFDTLEAMLQTSGFSSFHRFDFGGRSRDYGWLPNWQDTQNWFTSVLALCASHDTGDEKIFSRIRLILSKHFRGLWSDVGLHIEVDAICREFHQRRFWPEGWTAIRSIRRFRDELLPAEEEAKLENLERAISPQSLVEQVRAQVLRNARDAYDDIDLRDYEAQNTRREQQLIELGKTLAADVTTLDELMCELFMCSTGVTLGPFARGLVEATDNLRDLWNRLAASFRTSDSVRRSPELLACYLFNLHSVDVGLTEELLSESLDNPLLAEWFPVFQGRVAISDGGLQRLKQSLARKNAPADRYRGIGWSNKLEDSAILDLMPMILLLPKGFDVAVDTIHMRIFQEQREKRALSSDLVATGRMVIEACEFDRRLNREMHAVQEVIEACLGFPEAISTVELVFERLRTAHANFHLGFMEQNRMLSALLAAQPLIVLNKLFVSEPRDDRRGIWGFFDHNDRLGSPLDCVPEAVLFTWCDEDNVVRYPWIAARLGSFKKNQNSETREWKPTALTLLERAPNKIDVLKRYIHHFRPMGWSGSESATWEANARLLDHFENHPDTDLSVFARSQREELNKRLEELKRKELDCERSANERFE